MCLEMLYTSTLALIIRQKYWPSYAREISVFGLVDKNEAIYTYDIGCGKLNWPRFVIFVKGAGLSLSLMKSQGPPHCRYRVEEPLTQCRFSKMIDTEVSTEILGVEEAVCSENLLSYQVGFKYRRGGGRPHVCR